MDLFSEQDHGNSALEAAISEIDMELAQSYPDKEMNPTPPVNALYPDRYNGNSKWASSLASLPGYVMNIAGNGDQSAEHISNKRMRPMSEPMRPISEPTSLNSSSEIVSEQYPIMVSEEGLKERPIIYPKVISTDPVSSKIPIDKISFTRDELLNLTSEEYEDHVRLVSSLRNLTASEKNAIKRQRRLVKNRESAQASRQRKKDYVGDLEKKVDDLMEGIGKLKEIYSSVRTENNHLKNEVEFLTKLVNRIQVY